MKITIVLDNSEISELLSKQMGQQFPEFEITDLDLTGYRDNYRLTAEMAKRVAPDPEPEPASTTTSFTQDERSPL